MGFNSSFKGLKLALG